ncbi:MAG TPA: DNA polymerase III subunit beta [Patescibacteria group bacterium]|nr:DNA polymerase III subunit beta [Patescibacteria group bacterium]
MKIRVLQENLVKALSDALKSVPSKPQIPILSCVLLTAKQGKLHIRATDLSVGIHIAIGGKILEEGDFAVSAKVFYDAISSLKAGAIDLEVDDVKMSIVSSGASLSVQGFDSREFPPFPKIPEDGIELSLQDFSNLLEFGGIASGVDETRPVFSSVLFERDTRWVAVVATDGYRLSRKEIPIKGGDLRSVMAPAKVMREVHRIFERLSPKTVKITFSEDAGQMFFYTDDCEVAVRIIDSEYPSYSAIVPQECEIEAQISVEELTSAIKTAMVFSKDVSGVITLHLTKEHMQVTSNSASGESTLEVEGKLEKGDGGAISFNGKYLLDLLSALKIKTVKFGMNESLKPGIFTSNEIQGFYYVVMPFRVQT